MRPVHTSPVPALRARSLSSLGSPLSGFLENPEIYTCAVKDEIDVFAAISHRYLESNTLSRETNQIREQQPSLVVGAVTAYYLAVVSAPIVAFRKKTRAILSGSQCAFRCIGYRTEALFSRQQDSTNFRSRCSGFDLFSRTSVSIMPVTVSHANARLRSIVSERLALFPHRHRRNMKFQIGVRMIVTRVV